PHGSRNKWRDCRGLKVECALSESRDAREDLISGLGPGERLEIRMMCVDEVANSRFALHDAAVATTTQLFIGELGKPALDEIQPRAIGRREMHMKARPLGQPIADQRGLVRAVVVHDE